VTRLVSIAFRNLLRARRRNLLSGGTMALGTAALVLGGGLSDGIARQLTASLVAVQTGHLQVVDPLEPPAPVPRSVPDADSVPAPPHAPRPAASDA
jgi:ABC-type lipoprotein release transport system permease subunit